MFYPGDLVELPSEANSLPIETKEILKTILKIKAACFGNLFEQEQYQFDFLMAKVILKDNSSIANQELIVKTLSHFAEVMM